VYYEVKEKFSRFQSPNDLVNFAKSATILDNYRADDIVNIECCESNKNVCHGREGFSDDFFYFYSHVITNSHFSVGWNNNGCASYIECNTYPVSSKQLGSNAGISIAMQNA